MIYEVKIERKYKRSRVEKFFDGEYWWDVDVYMNNKWLHELDGCGWTKSAKKAKEEAIKHILDAEERMAKTDGQFGIIIKFEADAKTAVKKLEEHNE